MKLRKSTIAAIKNKFIVLFVIIFGTLAFRIQEQKLKIGRYTDHKLGALTKC